MAADDTPATSDSLPTSIYDATNDTHTAPLTINDSFATEGDNEDVDIIGPHR